MLLFINYKGSNILKIMDCLIILINSIKNKKNESSVFELPIQYLALSPSEDDWVI